MKILLIEDNKTLADLICFHFQKHDFIINETLEQALYTLKDNKDIELVLVDLGLPDSSGIFTIKAPQKIQKPKVVITGGTNLALECIEYGAVDYIEKNGPNVDFLNRIEFNIKKFSLNRPKKYPIFSEDAFLQIKQCIVANKLTTC